MQSSDISIKEEIEDESTDSDWGSSEPMIKEDIRRDSKMHSNKCHSEQEQREFAAKRKRHKTASKDSAISLNEQVRPKRGVQQLKSKCINLPFIHHLSVPVGNNRNGSNVISYTINSGFKRELVKTNEQKLECAGQIFARDLVKKNKWKVRACNLNGNDWDMVTYNVEADALEGKGKFTGYASLAQYMFQSGLAEMILEKSKEADAMLTQLNLSSLRKSATKPADEHDDDDEVHRIISPPAAIRNTNFTELSETHVPTKNTTTRIDKIITKHKYMMAESRNIEEKLAQARANYAGDDHVWERDVTVDFYNTIRRWLDLVVENESAFEYYREKVPDLTGTFEESMAVLKASDGNIDLDMKIMCNFVKEIKAELLSD